MGVSNRREPPPLPFPSGFPCALSRAGGGGAAAAACPPTPVQALGGFGIGSRIPEAGDPKVRAGLQRVWFWRAGDLTEQGWEWGRGPGILSLWAVRSRPPGVPSLGRDLCASRPGTDLRVCAVSARSDHQEISVPSDALTRRHLVSVRPEGGEICVSSHQGRALCAGTGASSLSSWLRPGQSHAP